MKDTILLVDDLPMMLEVHSDFFKDTDVKITTAKHGLEALAIIKEQKVSLVFLDKEMPIMDGLTCCKLIKSDTHYRNLPIAMVTWDKDRERCIASGCDFFLAKPARREQFLDIARKVIPNINRRTKRITVKIPAAVHHKSRRTDCFLYDLSQRGAFIATDRQFLKGELVEVSFVLQDGLQIRCFGEALWASGKSFTRPEGIGIKFVAMPRVAEEKLARFIDNCDAGHQP